MGLVTWLGAGPHESYADRKESAVCALHSAAVDTLHVPYIRPGENGSRCDTSWIHLSGGLDGGALPDRSSKALPSLSVCSIGGKNKGLFSFSASKYSIDDLNRAMHWSAMEEQRNASPSENGYFFLNIDPYMMGVGGDDSWTACVHKEFLLNPDVYEFSLLISPGRQQ